MVLHCYFCHKVSKLYLVRFILVFLQWCFRFLSALFRSQSFSVNYEEYRVKRDAQA